MRSMLLAVLALSVATPAVAAESESQRDMQDMAEKLNNPATQNAMAGALQAMLGAMLDIRVDGIAKAMEPMNGGKPVKMKGRTLREMAERKDRNFDKKLEGGSRTAVAGMGALAQAMATMMPELEKAMGKMGDVMDRVEDAADRN